MQAVILKILWVGLYLICGVLGLVSTDDAFSLAVMLILSILFFLPPALLLYRARRDDDRKTMRLVRRISALSLGATTALLILNVLSVLASGEGIGTALHYLLAIVSVPMLCSGSWGIPLFLWACLLWGSLPARKKRKS